ncbi:MAG TPA: alternative ribosome rescue aminoacyl-tRNA hydrolase ArfB [Bacteroidota bacterium]|nr:alternative ribosome rescue aminoacyl-tRNA hydrolase ArfB [Bacteroidota bacterium]
MTASLEILPGVRIATSEITFLFTRSRGPGGQNVNKVSSRVALQFDVANSPSLTVDQKNMLRKVLGKRIGADGVLQVDSQESRSQWSNREIALRKFIDLLSRALTVRKRRIPSGPTKASGANRLSAKKRRSGLKTLRRRVSHDD